MYAHLVCRICRLQMKQCKLKSKFTHEKDFFSLKNSWRKKTKKTGHERHPEFDCWPKCQNMTCANFKSLLVKGKLVTCEKSKSCTKRPQERRPGMWLSCLSNPPYTCFLLPQEKTTILTVTGKKKKKTQTVRKGWFIQSHGGHIL